MELTFKTKKLQKVCNSADKLRRQYGPRMSEAIQVRLVTLAAVDNLEHMRMLPGRCHQLSHDLEGHLALDLVHPERLIFKPNHAPYPELESGGLDWTKVTRVIITDIRDYHG